MNDYGLSQRTTYRHSFHDLQDKDCSNPIPHQDPSCSTIYRPSCYFVDFDRNSEPLLWNCQEIGHPLCHLLPLWDNLTSRLGTLFHCLLYSVSQSKLIRGFSCRNL